MSAKPETVSYRAAFAAVRDNAEPQWLATRREAALARFETLGFPTRRDEAWRFTDLRPLQRGSFTPARDAATTSPKLDLWRYPGDAHRLVLVNGRFAATLSSIGTLPKGAWLAGT